MGNTLKNVVECLTLSILILNNQGGDPISVSNVAIGWSKQLFYKTEQNLLLFWFILWWDTCVPMVLMIGTILSQQY